MKINHYIFLGVWCALAAGGLQATAQDTAKRQKTSLPVLNVPHTAAPPVIDGNLDDPAWSHSATIPQLGPCLGGVGKDQIALFPTTVRLVWDADYLYVAFECIGDHIDVDSAAKHDSNLYLHDACEVFLDPVGDGRQYMEFQISPLGQTLDVLHLLAVPPEYTSTGRLTPLLADHKLRTLREWEADGLQVASGRIRRNGKVIGWTVELAIPAAAIMNCRGLKSFAPGEIRANFSRYEWQTLPGTDKRDLLPMYWSPVEFGCPHLSAGLMGRLVLLEGVAPSAP